MKAKVGDTVPAARALIGAKVVSSTGQMFGHVIDLELDPRTDFQIVAVELGRHGWLDRLHLLRPIAHGRSTQPIRAVRWQDIDRLEGRTLVCKAGAKVTTEELAEVNEPSHPSRTAAGG